MWSGRILGKKLNCFVSKVKVQKNLIFSFKMSTTAYHNNKLFINGQWVAPSSNEVIPVINPSTEEVIGTVGRGKAEDVNRAVSAAKAAFNDWSNKTGAERAVFLRKIADLVKQEKSNLAKYESIDMGKPLPETEWDMDDVAGTFEFYADKAEELDKRQNTEVQLPHDSFTCKLRYEAVGVVGLIVPWNYPLLMAAWKVAPALGAGCTVVLKPSEWSCLTALELAEIVSKAGLPNGVLNVVTGYGADAGDALTNHEDVDAIAFTGSTRTGSNVMKAAANTLKNVSLELGGKGALIIFDDVDIEQAVEWIMFGVFWSNGQICSATSRVLIHSKIYDAVLRRLKEESEKVVIGDPLQEGVKLGPLVSQQQYEKVTGYVAQGVRDGAKVLTGGKRPDNLPRGYFLQPTVFVDVKEWMSIWKEEIFGPVVCVVPFESEEEAIHIANDSPYGLGAAVMSKDESRTERIAKRLRFGIVWVNCSQPCFTHAPWGGYKRSGVGRDLGQYGFDRFLEVKQITTYTTITEPWGWYLAKL